MDSEVGPMRGHHGDYSVGPSSASREEGGLQVAQRPDSEGSPAVSGTPSGSIQNVPIVSVMPLSPAQRKEAIAEAKEELRDLRAKIGAEKRGMKQADMPIADRMDAVIGLVLGENKRLAKKVELKELEAPDKSRIGQWFSRAGRKVYWGFKRSTGVGRNTSPLTGFINLSIDGHKFGENLRLASDGIKDNKLCAQLLREGRQRLDEIKSELESDSGNQRLIIEKETIENGIAIVEARMALNSPERDAKTAAIGGAQLGHSLFVVGTTIGGLTHGVASAASHIPGVAFVGAVLSVEGLKQCRSNYLQAKQDVFFVHGQQRNIAKVREELASFDVVLQMPEVQGSVRTEFERLNSAVKSAQKGLVALDNQLISGNLSKEQILEIRKQKVNFRNEISNSMKIARNLCKGADLKNVSNQLKAQQYMLQSAEVLETVVLPFLDQRLRNKAIGTYVKAAGEVLNITGGVLATGGVIASLTGVGAIAGGPMIMAGGVLTGLGAATTYGGGALVDVIKRMQRGKDRVSTEQFNQALFGQLKKEIEGWVDLTEEQQEGTCTKVVFDLLNRHDLGVPKDWTASQWAKALVDESGDGPYHLAFEAAKDRMIYHDATRGYIGSLASRVFARFTKPKPTVEPQVA